MLGPSGESTKARERTIFDWPSTWPSIAAHVGIALACLIVGLVLIGRVMRKPVDADRVWQAGQEALREERFDDAESALRTLEKLRPPTPIDWLFRAQVELARDRLDPALDSLSHIPDGHEMAPQARMMAGRVELKRHRARDAERLFREASRLDPKLAAAHRELIYILGYQLRRTELAAEFLALSKLTDLTFQNAFDWCLLRNATWEPDSALPELEKFMEADPDDHWSRLAAAENYRRMGKNDEAEKAIATLPESDPKVQALRVLMAIDRHEYDRAEELLANGSADEPELARLRGRLALARHDVEGAVRSFRVAYEKMPEDHDALFGLINALSLKGDDKAVGPLRQHSHAMEKVNTLIQRAANNKERTPALVKQLGAACIDAELFPEARAWYRLSIQADPLDQEAQQALSQIEGRLHPGEPGNGPPRAERAPN
ncbi:tetratricopeptide repeat protein [Aquisphaera insulae]|uniref:tetratricopeptide repeat protein n=1 Tax=Aquisphaera insulae TaxID=2712864 RepID=UPI0013EC0818|nr:tetratricopeptide repeat protein [Aquisphaera insulae]